MDKLQEHEKEDNKQYKSLKKNKEYKLKYDYKIIEDVINNFLIKYDLDKKISSFIYNKLEASLNKKEIFSNLDILLGKKSKKEYKNQLNNELFVECQEYIENLIKTNIDKELKELSLKNDKDYEIRKDIFENLFVPINLTLFKEGMNRITLVVFHYFLKELEKFAIMYLKEKNITNIKRTKIPLEIFIKDLIYLIGKNNEMTRFVLTIKSLIEQWLFKYSKKTKIGEFYYDILMITPEYIIEKVLKYLIFTAIKNMNPLTLRAIFSSYITLIHQNLYSFYSTNIEKVKIGYFKQLESLFTENFDLIFDNKFNQKHFIIDALLLNYLNFNKRYLKKDYYLFKDDFIQNLFEINYFELIDDIKLLNKNDINNKISLLDYSYFYVKYFKFVDLNKDIEKEKKDNQNINQDNIKVIEKYKKYHKLNSIYYKNSNKKKIYSYLKQRLIEKMYKPLYKLIKDKDTIEEICENIAKDLNKKINPTHFLNEDYETIELEIKEYLKSSGLFIENLISVL